VRALVLALALSTSACTLDQVMTAAVFCATVIDSMRATDCEEAPHGHR
jgi:hypothetical protein